MVRWKWNCLLEITQPFLTLKETALKRSIKWSCKILLKYSLEKQLKLNSKPWDKPAVCNCIEERHRPIGLIWASQYTTTNTTQHKTIKPVTTSTTTTYQHLRIQPQLRPQQYPNPPQQPKHQPTDTYGSDSPGQEFWPKCGPFLKKVEPLCV